MPSVCTEIEALKRSNGGLKHQETSRLLPLIGEVHSEIIAGWSDSKADIRMIMEGSRRETGGLDIFNCLIRRGSTLQRGKMW